MDEHMSSGTFMYKVMNGFREMAQACEEVARDFMHWTESLSETERYFATAVIALVVAYIVIRRPDQHNAESGGMMRMLVICVGVIALFVIALDRVVSDGGPLMNFSFG